MANDDTFKKLGGIVTGGETKPSKYRGLMPPWQPGQTGNPNGRPKGSRHKLGEAFVAALHDDFQANGIEAIEKVRTDKPADYLRVIAQVVPKELIVKDQSLEDMTEEELTDTLAVIHAAMPAHQAKKRKPKPPQPEQIN